MDDQLQRYLADAVRHIGTWEKSWGDVDIHPSVDVAESAAAIALERYLERLQGNYPFFHPRYAGQMLKPPHAVAIAGYVAAMLINPNNHALDGGPPTSAMEKESVRSLAAMFGFPAHAIGHLTSSGTIANLEALWVARELRPGGAILYSHDAHYTHGRMCGVLGVEGRAVPTNAEGEMDLSSLAAEVERGDVTAVVATAGTTGSGSIDDIGEIIRTCRPHDVRVHVDAAYGGFFRLLCGTPDLTPEVSTRLEAIAQCDSVVVDPHKHGLQPYGCGAVLFRDAGVGRLYRHDSPYTYFTSDDLHLGEISLECSRAGASAGAFWLTLQLLPLEAYSGLGPVLAACRRAARSFSEALESSDAFRLFRRPALDIVTFFPVADRASDVDEITAALFDRLMNRSRNPLFLSVLKVDARQLERHGVQADIPTTRIFRSVLMKPEHELAVEWIGAQLHEELRGYLSNESGA